MIWLPRCVYQQYELDKASNSTALNRLKASRNRVCHLTSHLPLTVIKYIKYLYRILKLLRVGKRGKRITRPLFLNINQTTAERRPNWYRQARGAYDLQQQTLRDPCIHHTLFFVHFPIHGIAVSNETIFMLKNKCILPGLFLRHI